MKKLTLTFILALCSVQLVWAYTPEQDREAIEQTQAECERISEMVVHGRFDVECGELFQLYNKPTRYTYRPKGPEVKIGSFNLYYPGSYKTIFKDFKLLAGLINRWDVIGVQELLGVMGQDAKHNEDVLKFLNSGDDLKAAYQAKLGEVSEEERDYWSEKLETLKSDLEKAPALYRGPGFLKLLEELRALDPSWALVVSPRAEAAQDTHVQEFSGFFFRGSKVKLRANPHCESERSEAKQAKYACLPNLRESFMGRDVGQIFSRRPFLASFQSSAFKFSLLTSHIVFTSPSDDEMMRNILMPAFGVANYQELGEGASKAKYARFAELKVILEFMNLYRQNYNDGKIVYLGDTNIEKDNPFWEKILPAYPGSDVFVDEPTTLTQRRYTYRGEETNALASNYDHFIYNSSELSECNDDAGVPRAHVFNYFNDSYLKQITSKYLIRGDVSETLVSTTKEDEPDVDVTDFQSDYEVSENYVYRRDKLMLNYDLELKSIHTIKDNKIVWDDYRYEELLEVFERRMFTEQLFDRTYYRFVIEAMSDHLPIALTCTSK